ncbi:MAG: hypothetical protein A2W19_17185 [Spirochaetes bacterium RBG_16_49_21]|nr:MAG: hypothetical protein A2W19_17185 [Spirochaetes bacterium RBG_16_49_21]
MNSGRENDMRSTASCILSAIIMALPAVPVTASAIEHSRSPQAITGTAALPRAGGEDTLLAQYLTDDKEYPGAEKKTAQPGGPDMAQKKFRLVTGLSGALSSQEGFAFVAAMTMFGIQLNRFSVTMDPLFAYSRTKLLKSGNLLLGRKSSAEVMEFGLPVKCAFSFLDLDSYQYSPYVQAGFGYDFRKYSVNGSSVISRISSSYYVDSLTLNYGFGFFVKTTEHTRFQIGLNAISYFNANPGVFSYDTTGASILFGLIVIFE